MLISEPQVGDCILVGKSNEKFDVIKINDSGEREYLRLNISPLGRAYEIARGALTRDARQGDGTHAAIFPRL
jgi:hypothetical protein